MLIDNTPESSSSSGSSPSAPRKSGGAIVLVLVIVLLVVGGIVVMRHSGGGPGGGAPGNNPTINNGNGSPPPTIFEAKAGAPIASSAKEWAVCANPNYEYWFEYPTAWTLSIPPDLTPQGAARMLQSPDKKSVAILMIPFGLYGSNRDSEIQKAEFTYLGDHTMTPGSEKKDTVNGQEVLRRQYTCRVPTAAGFDTWQAQAVLVLSKNMGYAIFLRADEKEFKDAMPTFDKLVGTFHVEKLPLRASGVAAPAPSGAPAAAPSGAPAASGAPAPAASGAPAPSAAPAASGAPAAAPEASGAPAPAASGAPAAAASSHPGGH